MKRILAIDGGGIRGVIPGVLLAHIEEKTGKAISECFDLLVGTSTGGILAAGLAVNDGNGKPKFTAAEMLSLYTDEGEKIFERSFWKGITSLGSTTDEKYDAESLEKILEERLGDATLTDTLKPLVITSYDIERREPYFFKTRKAKENSDRNHYLRDAARATSAAPTYFEPKVVSSLAEEPARRVLVDGGVFVNNPAMCAFSEAVGMGFDLEEILIVSLGTGTATRKILLEEAKDWGLFGWARPVISVIMDGQSDAAHYHLQDILPDVTAEDAQRYFRFDIKLEDALDDMDAANAANINALRNEAARILNNQAAEMDRLIALL